MTTPKSDSTEGTFDEAAALKSLQLAARKIADVLEAIVKLKLSDADVLVKLTKAQSALPAGAQIATAVDELREKVASTLAAARAKRASEAGRHEAAFIAEQKSSQTVLRELGPGRWRIGSLELELDRENSRARYHYNHEALGSWQPVRSAEDLTKAFGVANDKLKSAAIAIEALPELMWEAYQLTRHGSTQGSKPAMNPRTKLTDLYTDLRVAITRRELRSGKADRKLAQTEMPKWAFLYNLDRYRQILPKLNEGRRLTFETGSQQDHTKGLAMVVNGLDPASDYKSFCFVTAEVSGKTQGSLL